MDIAILSHFGGEHVLRWIHFIAGVTWIGLLYYFNFVQGEWFKEAPASTKSLAIQQLVPRALWWFRWGAMFTFLSGVAILGLKGHMSGGFGIYESSWGIFILTGALLGTFMFLNVWLIIWPNQKVVINSANEVAAGRDADPSAAACLAKAGLASRTNTLFSFPMLFFMGAAPHLGFAYPQDASFWAIFGPVAGLIVLLELNAIFGKMGPMASVKGVIHMGLLLTVVLYGLIEFLV